MRFHRSLIALGASAALWAFATVAPAQAVRPHPILFVTQPPLPGDFTSVNAVFGNHRSDLQSSNRGGDLWILYPNGNLKNLTAAAGWGQSGFQGAGSIAVREPAVHWSGSKAVFSMVVGAPTQRYQVATFYWQLYEITGLGEFDTPVITKVPRQPMNFNNVSPIYGTDERILFTSDRPRSGQMHHYPQLDEYESAPTVTGLWSLDPVTGELHLLNHTISGVFSPSIDSFGRLVFIRWDHLQRDQQADADAGGGPYGTFNYADESAGAARLNNRTEVFPEPRSPRTDLLATMPGVVGQQFNQFFPWAMNEDGTAEETVNHLGRHDFAGYFDRAFNDNAEIVEFSPGGRANPNSLTNYLQMRESPSTPGRFFGIDAPEFGTHAAGQVVSFDAPPSARPDLIQVAYWTHRDTSVADATPSPQHSGLYRNPLPLSDGTVVVVHTTATRADQNTGTRNNPGSLYSFRLKMLNLVANQGSTAGAALTGGISKSISYWDPDELVSYSGTLWELDPVEVRSRTKPATTGFTLDPIEQGVFAAQGVDLAAFRTWLRARDLALIVTRDVTTRDKDDRQQPFNLRVALAGGGFGVQSVRTGSVGPVKDVTHLQIVQADQIRGMGGTVNPRAGRRPIAQFLHDPAAQNPPNPGAPPGSVKIAADGSIAALVPARRAVSWAADVIQRHARGARALLAHHAAGRGARLHVVPRHELPRPGGSRAARQPAAGAGRLPHLLEGAESTAAGGRRLLQRHPLSTARYPQCRRRRRWPLPRVFGDARTARGNALRRASRRQGAVGERHDHRRGGQRSSRALRRRCDAAQHLDGELRGRQHASQQRRPRHLGRWHGGAQDPQQQHRGGARHRRRERLLPVGRVRLGRGRRALSRRGSRSSRAAAPSGRRARPAATSSGRRSPAPGPPTPRRASC